MHLFSKELQYLIRALLYVPTHRLILTRNLSSILSELIAQKLFLKIGATTLKLSFVKITFHLPYNFDLGATYQQQIYTWLSTVCDR